MFNTVLSLLFFGLMGSLLVWLFINLGKLWGDYIAPAIRDWRYERHMEKARQEFLRGLEKVANEERKQK